MYATFVSFEETVNNDTFAFKSLKKRFHTQVSSIVLMQYWCNLDDHWLGARQKGLHGG